MVCQLSFGRVVLTCARQTGPFYVRNSRLGLAGADRWSFGIKKSRFSEQQIAFILKQAEDGTTVEEVCRKAGISIQT